MSVEIKKLNGLISKLDKKMKCITTGVVVEKSGMQPLKVERIIYHSQNKAYILLVEQLDCYLVIDAESLDKAMSIKETL